jgi:hypothetical protein
MEAPGQVLSLGRGYFRTFLIAVLTSLLTAAALLEAWTIGARC